MDIEWRKERYRWRIPPSRRNCCCVHCVCEHCSDDLFHLVAINNACYPPVCVKLQFPRRLSLREDQIIFVDCKARSSGSAPKRFILLSPVFSFPFLFNPYLAITCHCWLWSSTPLRTTEEEGRMNVLILPRLLNIRLCIILSISSIISIIILLSTTTKLYCFNCNY